MFQKKYVHFSDWYRKVLFDADILDQRFPVKGFVVWKGHGTKIIERIMDILENLLEETNHSKTYFPSLIPEDLFGKESEHLKGFEDQVFWVERAGTKKIPKRLVVRPTSETAMYHMFSLWVRSHADLPIRIYQTVSVFRYETESTSPLIRDREVWPFNEAHTVHATPEEAEKQIKIGLRVYKQLFRRLDLPYLLVKKPEWELFPGAISAYEFYTLFPDGKVLETGSVNNLGQSFSKVFNITFEKEDGSREFAYQTCYGQSERLLAALVGVHGDDHGLILPFPIAPIPVVIVPILYSKNEEEVLAYSEEVERSLEEDNISVELDRRDLTPGEKYYYWEKRGIPVRLEIGSEEKKRNTVTIVSRHNLQRKRIPREDLVKEIEKTSNELDQELLERAEAELTQRIGFATSFKDVPDLVKEGMHILQVPSCRKKRCSEIIEERTDMETIGFSIEKSMTPQKCLGCSEETTESCYVAKSY